MRDRLDSFLEWYKENRREAAARRKAFNKKSESFWRLGWPFLVSLFLWIHQMIQAQAARLLALCENAEAKQVASLHQTLAKGMRILAVVILILGVQQLLMRKNEDVGEA